MDRLLAATLGKLIVPVVGTAFILAVTRKRGVSWRTDLGLRWPRIGVGTAWMAVWLVWIAASEVVISTLGLQQPAAWPDYPPSILLMRILAIGIVGPFFEELVARGAVFNALSRTALGPAAAIVIVAAVWAGVHYRYDLATISMIFADGLIFGLARHTSGSLLPPVAMHMVGNLVSIAESTLR